VTIVEVRDIIISILGIMSIILIIGLVIGMIIVYLKTRKVFRSVNRFVLSVHKWVANVQGMVKGFNESVNFIKKGG
jgi:uncharacterized membrane-anchored protein YhcB (DUF1043 family)